MRRNQKKSAAERDRTQNQPASYTMLHPEVKRRYLDFYAEIYKAATLDRKTKELISIAAALAARCQGCLEGHIKKALKMGVTREQISETIAIAMAVSAAAVVDLTDIAAQNLRLQLFPPQKGLKPGMQAAGVVSAPGGQAEAE